MRKLTFRSSSEANPRVPLGVRSTGHYQLTSGWREAPRKKPFIQLFWGISGEASFYVGDRCFELRGYQAFRYDPGEIHDIRIGESCEYFFLTFDHPAAADWIGGLGFSERLTAVAECPSDAYEAVSAALRSCTPAGERQSAKIAHGLLLDAFATAVASDAGSLGVRAKNVFDGGFREAGMCVAEAASILGVHRTTLCRDFREAHGLTPSVYLQNLRVQHALSLLREGTMQMQEVAIRSGFSDPNYFARSIRRATGMSPTEFRKSLY